MARKRSTCPWTRAWYDERVPPSLSLSFLDPFRDRSSCRPASTGKPIFGAGRSTSLTDECQANIDSPRGNWGVRVSLCATSAGTNEAVDGQIMHSSASLLAPASVFLHINARQCDSSGSRWRVIWCFVISGGNPPPSPWEEISRKRGAIVSVKSLYLNALSRRISRAEIFAKIERKYPKHILETAE